MATEAAARKLHGAGVKARIDAPIPPGSRRVSPRSEKEPDTTTYSGRVAARIRMLRKRAGMTREQFHAALAKHGLTVALSNVYAWENGNKGVNPDHYPAIAKALGCKSTRSLLPEN